MTDPVIIETADNPQTTIIWLHGLGADGNDFVPVVEAMDLSRQAPVRFVFPHAPQRPITINGGMVMRGWYDIKQIQLDQIEDYDGIASSADMVIALIEAQIKSGIEPDNIFLAGFSQGGAVALYTGLSCDYALAGVIALSTYVPVKDKIHIKNQPGVFYAHGLHDPVIPYSLAEQSRQWLLSHGIETIWRSYAMQHQVLPQEIVDINAWLIDKLQAK